MSKHDFEIKVDPNQGLIQKFIHRSAKSEVWDTSTHSCGETDHIGDWMRVGEGVTPFVSA